jgi:hypothetical protein
MTFEECEMTILRHYIDKNEFLGKKSQIELQEINKMTALLENYLRKKKLVCYGGTAINNILPPQYQFYDNETDIPDYDFYSPTPNETATEIADMYYKAGYKEVEAKSGVHRGTVKVFVNFIGIADVTLIHPELFRNIQRDAILVDGILYAPPNFLRMNAYIEISRPQGDVSRWEKVLKRLNLLNRFYPLKTPKKCQPIQRDLSFPHKKSDSAHLFRIVRDALIAEKVVFFGGYASSLYARYMPNAAKHFIFKAVPDFDALVEHPEKTANKIKSQLIQHGFEPVTVVQHPPVGEIIPASYEIKIRDDTVAFLYETNGCHNFNRLTVGNQTIRVATIDTILSFYLAFYYANQPHYEHERILCMAQFLFDVQKETKLLQKDILKRFNSSCAGEQHNLNDIKAEKSNIMKKYKNKTKDKEYYLHFFKYIPS